MTQNTPGVVATRFFSFGFLRRSTNRSEATGSAIDDERLDADDEPSAPWPKRSDKKKDYSNHDHGTEAANRLLAVDMLRNVDCQQYEGACT